MENKDVEIFGIEEKIWRFDTNLINILSFFALTFLTDINSPDFFTIDSREDSEYSVYLNAIEKESDSSDLDVLTGKLKEYIEYFFLARPH